MLLICCAATLLSCYNAAMLLLPHSEPQWVGRGKRTAKGTFYQAVEIDGIRFSVGTLALQH